MKVIIIGGGSIGKRHANNLADLKISTRIVDIDEINNIDNILLEQFDAGLVCTPNVNHIEHCIKLAQNNIPIFCEKPFFSFKDRLDELLDLVKRKNLITMVGCNMRFTPEVQKINSNTKYISVFFGYDLKKWRPNTDHLKSYSANKNLGGGILLDCIHEIDYLYHKFGDINKINLNKNKVSNITNDTEDIVTGRIEFQNGTIADIHLNYLSEDYTRYYDILEGDTLKRIFFNLDNKMYINEIQYFITQIKNNTTCMNNFEEANKLLNYIL